MDKDKHSIIEMISKFKFQIIINKDLFKDEVISKEMYEIVENRLLEKINNLSNELEYSI